MSSGSLKDLTKAISSSASNLSLPLPDDLQVIINAYLEKHSPPDESDSQRLQDELLSIYQSSIVEYPSRLAPFLAVLRPLKPVLKGSGRLLQWWDKLSVPVINNLGAEKGLAVEAKKTILRILVYDEDEENLEDAKATSVALTETVLATWLAKTKSAAEDFDDHSKFVEGQIQMILVSFGKKRPTDFLTTINKFFVKKDNRILVLSLLCEFIRHQPPHLHQLLQTPLFDNLLRCLQIDTSTRVISLAMTALVMFLPHIPSAASNHLPALFNIYSRMLFWDRERRAGEPQQPIDDDEKSEKSQAMSDNGNWEKFSYLLESNDETVPELLHYFTFLYGLYPINFMSYIRKPQRYLRHANFPGADDLDIEPAEIRERSETFRQVHLLHPNFFMLTIESELTDNNRWMRSEAADVVAECMALYNPPDESHASAPRSRGPAKKIEPNSDVPDQPLLDEDTNTLFQSRHNSWRDTRSTAVASPEGCRMSGFQRQISQTSQSIPSIADSPSAQASDRLDSPTLPPTMLASPSNIQLADMLNSQKSTRDSIYQALTNDSVGSLALSHHNSDPSHVDTYLMSLARDTIPRSPSLRPTINDPGLKVAYLHREIQLLRNDLNFEKYLKQQHLWHIGQLRRKQIKEARVEAETQNLINSNRSLKSKLEEAKRANMQMKKETEKSKTHSRKWESELSAKLRILREEQKKWNVERRELQRDLELAREDVQKLRQLVVTSEAREMSANQKVKSVESSLDELERLRAKVADLTLSVQTYEVGEHEALRAKENEEEAFRRVEILEMELRARDSELAKAKQAFDSEVYAVRLHESRENQENGSAKRKSDLTQDFIDSALASSRHRIAELQKAHNHLLKRYTALHSTYMDLREQVEQREDGDDALLAGGISGHRSNSPSPTNNTRSWRRGQASSEPGIHESVPVRSRLDTSFRTTTPTDGRSPISAGSGIGTSHAQGQPFQAPQPFNPQGTSAMSTGKASNDSESLDGNGNVKQKIKPQSDVRIYGRGGVQNIGKKEKEKKDVKEKGKDKDGKEGAGDGKKEKKGMGSIRGIRGFV